jgi:ABC-type nitrate/sulfonate/bicarbonate transport system permease component
MNDPAAGNWLAWAVSGELPHDVLASLTRVVVGLGLSAGLFNPVLQLLFELGNPPPSSSSR